MSEYTDYEYEFEPRFSESTDTDVSSSTSDVLSTAADLITAFVARLDEMQSSLPAAENTVMHRLGTHTRVLAEFPALEREVRDMDGGRLLDEITETVKRPDSPANEAATMGRLTNAIQSAKQRVLQKEAGRLHDTIVSGFREMGYSLSKPATPPKGAVELRGSKEDGTAISISFAPQNARLQLDLSGFDGERCILTRHELEQYLDGNGIQLNIIDRDHHNRKGGSALTEHMNARLNCPDGERSHSHANKPRNKATRNAGQKQR